MEYLGPRNPMSGRLRLRHLVLTLLGVALGVSSAGSYLLYRIGIEREKQDLRQIVRIQAYTLAAAANGNLAANPKNSPAWVEEVVRRIDKEQRRSHDRGEGRGTAVARQVGSKVVYLS